MTSNGAAVRKRLRLPLIAALALAFISLSLISGIAYIVVLAGATNTAEKFVVDRAARVVDAQVASIRIRLDAVTDHLQMVAALAGSGRLDISSPVDMREALWVMMTQVPSISSAAFATFDLKMVRVIRRPDGQVIRDTVSLADLPRGMERFRELQTSACHLLGRAVLERRPAAAGAQCPHADPAHRRRLHRRPAGHGGARRPVGI